jgi:hypothetical protein
MALNLALNHQRNLFPENRSIVDISLKRVKAGKLEHNLVIDSNILSADSHLFVGCGRP